MTLAQLLADTAVEPATPTTIIGAFIFLTLALMGLVGWLIKHVFVTTIPGIMAEMQAQREANANNLKAVMENSNQSTAAERALCAEQFSLVQTQIAALTTAVRQEGPNLIAEINRHTTEQAAAYRHDLVDKMNEAVLGRELHLAQKAAKIREDQAKSESARTV